MVHSRSMCGRYASFQQNQDLLDAFLIDPTLPLEPEVSQWTSSWNIAPTQNVRMIVERPVPGNEPETTLPPVRSLRLAKWGLVPSWSKTPDIGARMINARAESVQEKPSFKAAFAKRRCLIPADGFYEWLPPVPGAPKSGKIPQFIHRPDGAPLAFAGLYEFWRAKTTPASSLADAAPWLVTCTILTTAAQVPLAEIHDRRPVMLGAEHWDSWLAPQTSLAKAAALLRTPAPELSWHSVSTRVNTVAQNDPTLINHAEPPAAARDLFTQG